MQQGVGFRNHASSSRKKIIGAVRLPRFKSITSGWDAHVREFTPPAPCRGVRRMPKVADDHDVSRQLAPGQHRLQRPIEFHGTQPLGEL